MADLAAKCKAEHGIDCVPLTKPTAFTDICQILEEIGLFKPCLTPTKPGKTGKTPKEAALSSNHKKLVNTYITLNNLLKLTNFYPLKALDLVLGDSRQSVSSEPANPNPVDSPIDDPNGEKALIPVKHASPPGPPSQGGSGVFALPDVPPRQEDPEDHPPAPAAPTPELALVILGERHSQLQEDFKRCADDLDRVSAKCLALENAQLTGGSL